MSISPIWDWFTAALIHDLGKINLNQAGTFEAHHDLARTPFGDMLPADLVQRVAKHHDEVDLQPASHTPEEMALIMADRFQKAMHQTEGWEDDQRLSKLTHHPAFYPFYGSPQEGWDYHDSQVLGSRIRQALEKESGREGYLLLCHLLALQDQVTAYPHTTYLPHLSLKLHQRFTALLLYFLMRQMQDGSPPPNEIRFSVLTVSPEPMTLFYRLRDVSIYGRAVKVLRDQLFRRVFLADQAALPGLSTACNPFEFFDGGSGLVLVYDQPERVIAALQEILDGQPFLRSLSLEVADFHLTGSWHQGKRQQAFFARPEDVAVRSRAWSLISSPVANYPPVSLERCQVCGRPDEALAEDITGDLLCPSCLGERRQRRDGAVDIHKVSDQGEAKVGFVFLALKEPLYEQAQEVAAGLLGQFMSQRMVLRILEPTRGGLFEYLQAIQAIGEFQDRVEETIAGFRRQKPNAAYTLLRLPTQMVYLVHEEFYWPFLSFLNAERDKLRLPNSLRAVLCGPTTPFWSLMDGFLAYDEEGQDLYYDEAEGSIVMFTPDEVRTIYDLAAIAERDWRSSAQLIDVSRFAISHNLAELLLEIDVRSRQDKLPWRLTDPLKQALENLDVPEEENKAQTKRAKFIDYIARMARPQQSGGKKRR